MKKSFWLFIVLLMPLIAAQLMQNISVLTIMMHLLVSASLTTLLSTAHQQKKWLKRIFKTLLIGFYFTFLFMLLFEGILFDFTGNGFTNEVYFHFEIESLRIGFNEYPAQIMVFVFLIFFYIYLINKLLKVDLKTMNKRFAIIAILLLFTATLSSSLTRFSNGLINYHWQDVVDLDEKLVNKYIDLGVLQNGSITTKNKLKAETQPASKNLILLYLESFNEGLLDSTKYPELTPNLDLLSQKYQKLNHLSSSYVTIEGIISSQCGIMLPMTAGSNTFLSEGQLLSNMPCLGDVLSQAGYTQYYLGGAQMEFAGKGRFLKSHGYNHTWGLEHWKANGLKIPKGEWGLSDNVLFDHALKTIKTAAETPPYNVSLLTLGTHIPGFIYDGCTSYQNSKDIFIDAIHCTDHLVGKFVAELEQAGLLDNTVLMIVADHGVFPTKQMKELFSDVADDRHLIGITNYPLIDQNTPISSYDLAPTLLDMLGINHNANFLFGQSKIKPKDYSHQKYVTRLADWHESKLTHNSKGECNQDRTINWPLNNCQKEQLIGLTNQLLENYSIKEKSEQLSCQLNIMYTNEHENSNSKQWALWLNESDEYGHFYSNGFSLKTRHVTSGHFVFVLNDDQQIEKHVFFKNNEKEQIYLKAFLEKNSNPLLIIKTQIQKDENLTNLVEIKLYNQKRLLWSEQTTTHVSDSVNICD